MKKLLLLLLIVLSGCKCLMSQLPPQFVYVGEDCTALLPNYVEQVTVTDNCGLKSIVQTPAVGYALTATNQSVEVTIRATDLFGNFSEIRFVVTAVDTIKPVITPSPELLSTNWDVIHKVYNVADKLVAEQEKYFDANFDWEAAGIPENKRPIGEYNKKVLSILTSPGHAETGYGSRVIMFVSNNDTYIAK